ncbi:MAG: hypothetical protein EBY09_04475 [Verrucomicrobia bacterium]|nr:hypothetical protein [Verrucomicrobiota bacterium]
MKRILSLLIGALLLAAGRPAHAQWTTQTVTLKPGWNAVYLHVDATHTTLAGTVGADGANPITEVWLWQPIVAQGRFINNPQQPAVVNNDWSLWNRNPSLTGSLRSLVANHAYLVRNGSGATYTWNIVGRPALPNYSWTAQGVNFIGFPTPPVNPPVVDTFFSPVPALASQAEIYYYPGNEAAGAAPTTAQLFSLFSTPLKRGQAFWIRANNLHAEIVIGLNRAAMTNSPNQAGDLYEGIFRLNDSLGYTQIELPVTAVKTSNRGLWVGNATIDQVRHYLKAYQRDGAGQPVVSPLSSNGAAFVVTNLDTSWGAVRSPFNLRLIVHSDTNNTTRLLQRVFSGWDRNTNAVLCLREQQLDPQQLDKARRISAAHLPWSAANAPWNFTGTFQTGGSITNVVNLDYNDHASNPFLHTYHPDHDNLNATFNAVLPVGVESYGVRRTMVLTFTPPPLDYTSLTTGGTRMEGTYEENITLLGRAYVLGGVTTNETRTGNRSYRWPACRRR